MPTCQQVTEQITDFLEDRLERQAHGQFISHLSKCGGCTHLLRQTRRTVEALGLVPREPLPDQARANFQNTFRDWKRNK